MKSLITNLGTKLFIGSFVLLSSKAIGQIKTYDVDPFDEVIVSPHIAVTFVAGDTEKITVESNTEPLEKFNVEVVGSTLRLYLDGAKMVTKNKKYKTRNSKLKKPLYKNTVIIATVTYKKLNELSLRGEEKFVCKSPIDQPSFRLKVFGESEVYLNELHVDQLTTTIYGESYVELRNGRINRQKITAYGETTLNSLQTKTKETKITAYGEGSYRVAVSDRLKVTAYGEATIAYEGSPEVNKGIVIGEASIQKIN